jgi:hypothetical protein
MRDFINENNISFEQGSRNSSIVTLIGYAQHKGLTKNQLLDALEPEIKADSFIAQEVDRLYNYCKDRNYKAFWSTEDAKMQYTF